MRVGLDIGSTTIKCVVLGEHDELLYSTYERHYSHILEKAQELLRRIDAEQLHGSKALLSISGSAGMGLADSCGVPFVQEVFSTRVAVKRFMPQTDCVIELGGEDAKILSYSYIKNVNSLCFICYSGIFCLFYQNQALGFLHYI